MNSIFNILLMSGVQSPVPPTPPVPQGPMISGRGSGSAQRVTFKVTEHNNTTHNVQVSIASSPWQWDNPSGWNIKKIQFTGIPISVASITLAGDWSTVTDMSTMFSGFSSYASNVDITIDNINTSNVTTMRQMFASASWIRSIDAKGLDTSNVTDMVSMFANCQYLRNVDITGIDTSKVTDMSSMFGYNPRLQFVEGIESIDISSVEYFDAMFSGCSSLVQDNGGMLLNDWHPNSAISFRDMFVNCTSLENISLCDGQAGHPLYRNVANINYMFSGCTAVEQILISGITNENNSSNMEGTFKGCTGLQFLALEDFVTTQITSSSSWTDFLQGVQSTIIYKGSQWNSQIVSAFPNNAWQNIG